MNRLNSWIKKISIIVSLSAPLLIATPAFASSTSSTSGLIIKPGQTTIDLTVPNLDKQLLPSPTLTFTFTPEDTTVKPMNEIGKLVNASIDEYAVPLPNFGKKETVNISVAYTYNGINYTATAGPLVDTLPEAPFAALIPLALVGVWYFMSRKNRKRLV